MREEGCNRFFIVTITLVCVPAELLERLDKTPHSWTEGDGQALLAARCAFQRTLYLDVSGAHRAAAGELMSMGSLVCMPQPLAPLHVSLPSAVASATLYLPPMPPAALQAPRRRWR